MGEQAVALVGNLSDGFLAIGPYENFDAAANAHDGDECWILTLQRERERNWDDPNSFVGSWMTAGDGICFRVVEARGDSQLTGELRDEDGGWWDLDALSCVEPPETMNARDVTQVAAGLLEPTEIGLNPEYFRALAELCNQLHGRTADEIEATENELREMA